MNSNWMLLFLSHFTNACVQLLCAKVSFPIICENILPIRLVCDLAAKKFPSKVSFPSTKVETQKCRDVLPLSLVFVAMIAFNNLCLQEVSLEIKAEK
jgi:hypothetical protein